MSSGVAGQVSVRLFGVDVMLRRTLSPALSHREREFYCFFINSSPWSPSPVGEPVERSKGREGVEGEGHSIIENPTPFVIPTKAGIQKKTCPLIRPRNRRRDDRSSALTWAATVGLSSYVEGC